MTDSHCLTCAFTPDGRTWPASLEAAGLAVDGHEALVSAPVRDPSVTYAQMNDTGLVSLAYRLPPDGLSNDQRSHALDALETYLTDKRAHMLGYQVNQDMNHYRETLSRFMINHLNNIGDPFQSGCYKPNTKLVERAVLDYYASLWRARWPHDPSDRESYWGYMLSMGSTEGNMYGLWNARDYLSGRALINDPRLEEDSGLSVQVKQDGANRNAYRPVAFFSEDTHYSLTKAVRVLNIETFHAVGEAEYPDDCPLRDRNNNRLSRWPTEVPSKPGMSGSSADGPGDIDPDALATLVDFFASKGHPILVSLNFGSTFKGAHDDVRTVCERLLPIFHRYDMLERELHYGNHAERRRGFWIHVDGALGAGYAPFMRMAASNPDYGYTPEVPIPEFDFGLRVPLEGHGEIDMVSSIAMSGHKWPGTPWPCGIFMTKVKYQVRPPTSPEYIGSPDTTFAGSRNGFSPLLLWDYLSRHPYRAQVKSIERAQKLAQYLKEQLETLEDPPGSMWVARTPGALTVRFRRPVDQLISKWSLSPETVYITSGGRKIGRDYAHAFVMAGTTRQQIDELIEDLRATGYPEPLKRAFATQAPTPEPAPEVLDNAARLAAVPWSGRGFE
ncbi:histidine decarboxylase [Kitasatospora hibisci]|uniref:histidine decarboxylase n=1 Tax=Kitasatospora hibisci TaxID=3369522 RepID=UPI003754B21F